MLAMAAVVVALGAVHVRQRPSTLCTLRALTGVPCPFCGGTTAAVDLGQGDPIAALRASPLAVVVIAVLPVLGAVRARLRLPSRAARTAALAIVLLGAEAWQLARFGFLS
jgi:Protein of unknown function (DUF2752)